MTEKEAQVDGQDSTRELRRRAEELAALNDLARRLAALHEPHELLAEVARQAQRLLRVDVAYIMLVHDERLRIEVVEGSLGVTLRGIELGPGDGLGGWVLQTGAPLWSENYLLDGRFPRPEGLEAAAQQEQLGGILGVPLTVGGTTLGVLLAADRHPRRFTEHEVELLAGLAAHAAVTLRNADLFDQQRAAAAQLRTAHEALQLTEEQLRAAGVLRDRLGEAVLSGGGLDAVRAALEAGTGHPVEVRDPQGKILTGGGVGPSGHTVPVTLPGGHVADLVAPEPVAQDPHSRRLLQIGAASVALVLASERSLVEAELRTRGEFLHSLLDSRADPRSLTRRAAALGIDLHRVATVVVLDPGGADPSVGGVLASRILARFGGWSAVHGGCQVVLVPDADPLTTRGALPEPARSGPTSTPVTVGLAACEGGPAGVRSGYRDARATATVLLALDRPGARALADELEPYRGLFGRAGRGELRTFVQLMVGDLVQHDHDRSTDLVRTLETYLDQGTHHARTCATLHIHPNTLYQRLDRIRAVIGTGWQDPGRSLEIHLALRLHGLLARIPG